VSDRLKFLITGTGHSGTKYASRLLTENGVKCGHEDVFRGREIFHLGNAVAESSCYGWMHWAQRVSVLVDAKLVHLVRHPVDVLNSWHRSFMLSREDPAFAGHDIRFDINRWYDVNSIIERLKPDVFCRAEAGPRILGKMGIEQTSSWDDRRINDHARHRDSPITWDELPLTTRSMATRYGYLPDNMSGQPLKGRIEDWTPPEID